MSWFTVCVRLLVLGRSPSSCDGESGHELWSLKAVGKKGPLHGSVVHPGRVNLSLNMSLCPHMVMQWMRGFVHHSQHSATPTGSRLVPRSDPAFLSIFILLCWCLWLLCCCASIQKGTCHPLLIGCHLHSSMTFFFFLSFFDGNGGSAEVGDGGGGLLK